jgi:hypothetical protein
VPDPFAEDPDAASCQAPWEEVIPTQKLHEFWQMICDFWSDFLDTSVDVFADGTELFARDRIGRSHGVGEHFGEVLKQVDREKPP